MDGAHEGVAYLPSLHHLPKREAQVPHPLTRDLPEFLSALGVRAPAIGIFFDIFISEDRLECSTSMIQVQDILGQEPMSVKGRKEEFIDPLTHTLAHLYELA